MKIVIKILKGQDCTLEVQPTETISSIKQKIENELSIPQATQKLLYLGRTLNDENSVGSYRIQEGCKINLIVAQKPELRDVMYKSFRKHYSDAVADKLSKEFVAIFSSKLNQMSLDDIERLSSQFHKMTTNC